MEAKELNPWVRYMDRRTCRYSYEAPVVAYDCRLFCVGEGALRAEAGGMELAAGQSGLLYIPSGTPYRLFFDPEKPCDVIVVNFDLRCDRAERESMPPDPPERFDRARWIPVGEYPPLSRPFLLAASQQEGLLGRALSEYNLGAPFSRELCACLVKQALLSALRQREGGETAPPLLVRQMVRFLEDHLEEPIDGERLSEEFHYHAYYLGKRFKRAMGMSVHQYLLSRRMKACAALLADTDLSVRQIAARVGFSSPSYFSEYFRKAYGMSPQQYRRRGRTI